LLLIARQSFSRLLICILALFQQVVIQPAALIKSVVQLLSLFLRRKNSLLKHFTHIHIVDLNCRGVNGQGTPILSPKQGTPFIPRMNDGGFQAI
jgi:hypothetical protein